MHHGNTSNGENLSNGGAETAMQDWYDSEIGGQNYSTGKCDRGVCGHATQIVWKSTTKLGCGMSGRNLVCQYSPRGNSYGMNWDPTPFI